MNTRLPSVAFAAMLAIPGFAFAESAASSPGSVPVIPAIRPVTDSTTKPQPASPTYVTADRMEHASKIIGATVYNEQNEKIGRVEELLLGDNYDIEGIVLSVGGFLGTSSKLVKVPAADIKVMPDRLMMSGASKDQLKHMPDFQPRPAHAG